MLHAASTSGGYFAIDQGRTLVSDQWLTWASGSISLGYSYDLIFGAQAPTLVNDRIFYVTANGAITGTGSIINAAGAVIAVFAGAGEANFDTYLGNSGYIQAQTGVLGLNGGGTSNASHLFATQNAIVQFGTAVGPASTPFTFQGGLYTVANTSVQGGTVDLSGVDAAGFSDSLTLASGKLQLRTLSTVPGAFTQAGGELAGSGYFTVAGPVSLTGGVETGAGVTALEGFTNLSGSLSIDGTRILDNAGTLIWNGGTLTLGGGDPTATVDGGTLRNDGNMLADNPVQGNGPSSGQVINAGTMTFAGIGNSDINAAFSNFGAVAVTAGTLTLHQVHAGGLFLLEAHGTLDFAGAVSNAQVQFLYSGGELETNQTGLFGATISGFATGDSIDAAAVAFSATNPLPVFNNGTLTVTDGTNSASFGLTGSYTTGGTFHAFSDGHGGTAISFS